MYCKHENFHVGVIFVFFTHLSSSLKLPPHENKNPYVFMKEMGVVSWKLPPREMSCKHFRDIFPQRK